jgi:hypothetical protein
MGPFSRKPAPVSDTDRYAAVEAERVRGQAAAARREAALSIQGISNREWVAACERSSGRTGRRRRL